jgi:hypothetical protein
MTMKNYLSCALLALLPVFSGCISSPLSADSVAALYSWSDRDTPIAQRKGMSITDYDGMFDGDLDFRNVLEELPGLKNGSGQPFLLEACEDEVCYFAVVFAEDFTLDKKGRVKGLVALTGISTAMYYEVMNLPAEQVRARLDALAESVLDQGMTERSYRSFISLDVRRLPDHRAKIHNDYIVEVAAAEIDGGNKPTLTELLAIVATRTSDLQASSDFNFSDAWDLSVDVDVSARISGPAYLTICSNFSETAEGYDVDYDNCQLKTALRDGAYQGSLKMTGTKTRLLVTLLDFSKPEQPQQLVWERGNPGDEIRLR